MSAYAPLIVGIIALIVGLLFGRKTSITDAKILDLSAKLKEKQDATAKDQADADAKVKDYLDSLKKYDPDFDDESGPKGSA